LMGGGFAHPGLPNGDSPESRRGAVALNRAVAESNADGAEMPRLAVPVLGSAVNVDMTETLVVGALLAGQPAEVEALTAVLEEQLRRGGRTLQKDGKPVTDPKEAKDIATAVVRHVLDKRAPVLRRLGVLGA
jgi:hypothetical protein